jgi:hypothetical protein
MNLISKRLENIERSSTQPPLHTLQVTDYLTLLLPKAFEVVNTIEMPNFNQEIALGLAYLCIADKNESALSVWIQIQQSLQSEHESLRKTSQDILQTYLHFMSK